MGILYKIATLSPSCSTSNSLPGSAPGRAGSDGPGVWNLATHAGDLDGIPGSWLNLAQPHAL